MKIPTLILSISTTSLLLLSPLLASNNHLTQTPTSAITQQSFPTLTIKNNTHAPIVLHSVFFGPSDNNLTINPQKVISPNSSTPYHAPLGAHTFGRTQSKCKITSTAWTSPIEIFLDSSPSSYDFKIKSSYFLASQHNNPKLPPQFFLIKVSLSSQNNSLVLSLSEISEQYPVD